jgi:carbonic anhydrase
MSQQIKRILLIVCGVVCVSCSAWPFAAKEATPAAAHKVHWGYSGDVGPDHWDELSADFALCGSGMAQTPIDIIPTNSEALVNPVFAYQAGDVTIVNNGHTIQANAAAGNTMTIDGVTYTLAQMHFHAPSEHTINGVPAAMELHFVHKAADGTLAVVGALVQQGDAANAAWGDYVSALQGLTAESTTATVDWPALLPAEVMTFRYIGSLTTPPCSEGVHWLVIQTPLQMSAEQIAAFTQIYTGNARPVQDSHDREVVADSSK